MKKSKFIVTKTAAELADALNLSAQDVVEIQVRRRINDKIISAVKSSGLTHAQVAAAAATSRTRVTAILNRSTANISTDLMLRILASLGYQAKLTFSRVSHAA